MSKSGACLEIIQNWRFPHKLNAAQYSHQREVFTSKVHFECKIFNTYTPCARSSEDHLQHIYALKFKKHNIATSSKWFWTKILSCSNVSCTSINFCQGRQSEFGSNKERKRLLARILEIEPKRLSRRNSTKKCVNVRKRYKFNKKVCYLWEYAHCLTQKAHLWGVMQKYSQKITEKNIFHSHAKIIISHLLDTLFVCANSNIIWLQYFISYAFVCFHQ